MAEEGGGGVIEERRKRWKQQRFKSLFFCSYCFLVVLMFSLLSAKDERCSTIARARLCFLVCFLFCSCFFFVVSFLITWRK
jgi:hypothetical protein